MARFGSLGTQYFDDAGDPLVNGKIYFFEPETNTKKDTFADEELTIKNQHPVLLSAAGRQPNIFYAGPARAVLTKNDDTQVEERDPVGGVESADIETLENIRIYGILPWRDDVDYQEGAFVLGSDLQHYKASMASGPATTPRDPISNPGFWYGPSDIRKPPITVDSVALMQALSGLVDGALVQTSGETVEAIAAGLYAYDPALVSFDGESTIASLAMVGGFKLLNTVFERSLADDSDQDKGASLVGYAGGTVKDVLDNVLTANEMPFVIDMHFGSLCGSGWTASEPPFSVAGYSVTATSSVSIGATEIPVNTSMNFAAGMMITYVGTDGQYYPARLQAILAGPIFRLDRQTVAPIANGGLIWNVYRDDAHPNTPGGQMIVDDALRQLATGRTRELEWRGMDGSIWQAVLGAGIASTTANDYRNPGTATIGERATTVTGGGVNQGARSSPVALIGGDYIARILLNLGTRSGGLSGSLQVFVDETRPNGTVFTIAQSSVLTGYDGTMSVELLFSSAPNSALSVRVTSPNAGVWSFTLGALEYHKLSGAILDVNRGKHVLLGDSWFVSGGAIHNAMIARLDNAEVVSKGVVGNTAAQLIARFVADVVPENPDFVWVMVGTNDYYASVSPDLFEQQILQLRRQIQAIGAQPIFFTPSVGAITFGPPQLHPSRRYALNVRYYQPCAYALGVGVMDRVATCSIQGLSVAAGATVTGWVFPAQTRKPGFLRFLLVNTAGVNIRFEYVSTADGSGGVEPTIFNTASPVRDTPLPRVSDTALRLIALRINNPTGAPIVVALTADVCWQQDLV